MKNPEPYYTSVYPTVDEFLLDMLQLGKPLEVSLIGVFDEEGRGSRRDIELPFHRDGEYSEAMAKAQGGYHTPAKDIDIVGMYCIRDDPNKSCKTTIESQDECGSFTVRLIELHQYEALIFDNKKTRHGRLGQVGNRLVLRVWIKRKE